MIRVGDLVRNTDQILGTVTYIRHGASGTPLKVTVCTGPSPFDLIHPNPADVRAVA